MTYETVRQRVGIDRVAGGWCVVVRVGEGEVAYDDIYPSPAAAHGAAVAQALKLGEMWKRLGVRIIIRVWVHEDLKKMRNPQAFTSGFGRRASGTVAA